MGLNRTKAKNPVQSARTTFRIVEGLKELDGAGVTELANHLDLSKASVYNYLTTLEEEEYVVKDGSEYQLGLQFLNLGTWARRQQPIFEAAKSELDTLADETGEFVNLLVEEHGRGVYLYRAIGENATKHKEYPGYRSHLHNTAVGKSILAHMPEDEVEAIVEERGMPATATNTITDPEELYRNLSDIRDRGYAFDREESMDGFRCVGAPVINKQTESVEGAISVSGPRSRMRDERFEEEIPRRVLDAVNVIEINISV